MDRSTDMQDSICCSSLLLQMIKDPDCKVPIYPFFTIFCGLPESGKTTFLNMLFENKNSDDVFFDTEKGFCYDQFITTYHGDSQQQLEFSRVSTETSLSFALLSCISNSSLKCDISTFKESGFNNEDYVKSYIKKFVEFAASSAQDAMFSVDHLRKGISFLNIWDVSIDKALFFFLKSFNGSFKNGYMCLFMDLDRDAEKLHQPPYKFNRSIEGSQEIMWRSRLHYLLRLCKIVSYDNREESGCPKVCKIFAKCPTICSVEDKEKYEKVKKDVELEIEHAARQIGVEKLVHFDITLFDPDEEDAKKKVNEEFRELIQQQKKIDIPFSWILLRGALNAMGTIIIKKPQLRAIANSGIFQMRDDELTRFIQFFSSFGSLFCIENKQFSTSIIIRPVDFLKRLDKLFQWSTDSSVGIDKKDCLLMKNGLVTATATNKVFGIEAESFMEVLQSIKLAVKLNTENVAIADDVDDQYCYYIPSIRNGESIRKLDDYEAIHLCIGIASPIVNLEVPIATHLLKHQDARLILKTEINLTEINILNTASIRFTCQGDVIELKVVNALEKDLPKICSHVINACKTAIEISSDKKMQCNFGVLCKLDAYPSATYNIYHLRHTLPDQYLCHECFTHGLLNSQVKAWNKAIKDPKNEMDPVHLLQPELNHDDKEIVLLSETIAKYPDIAVTAFAHELSVEVSSEMFFKSSDEKAKKIRSMIKKWKDHQLKLKSSTSIKTILARKMMKLHNLFQLRKEAVPNEDNSGVFFNKLARRLDIQVCSKSQFDDWASIEKQFVDSHEAKQKQILVKEKVIHWDKDSPIQPCEEIKLIPNDKELKFDLIDHDKMTQQPKDELALLRNPFYYGQLDANNEHWLNDLSKQNKKEFIEERTEGTITMQEIPENVCIIDETEIEINGDKDTEKDWIDCGFRMKVCKGTVNHGEVYKVPLRLLFQGEFILPPYTNFVSAVYDIPIIGKVLKPITVEVQHCYSIESEEDQKYLSFVIGKPTRMANGNIKYLFKLCDGGYFPLGSDYGSIQLSEFSKVAIVKGTSRSETTEISSDLKPQTGDSTSSQLVLDKTDYKGQLFYEKQDTLNEWNMKFVALQNLLPVWKKVMSDKLKGLDEDSEFTFQFLECFRERSIVLDIPPNCESQGWDIKAFKYPYKLAQKELDKFVSSGTVPQICLKVYGNSPKAQEQLHMELPFRGVRLPSENFMVYLLRTKSEDRHHLLTNNTTSSANALTNDEQVKRVKKLIRKGLTINYAYLKNSCERSLVRLAAELYQFDIITVNVKSDPTYDHIQMEFMTIIDVSESVSDMEEKCKCFLNAFRRQQGPMTFVANKVQKEWINKISTELGIRFQISD